MAKITPEGEENQEKMDPELENGPINNRYCTDVLCCLLFVASICAMVGIGIYGVSSGDPSKLLAGFDPDGQFFLNSGKACGISPSTKNHKYIFFVTPITGHLNRRVCVSECPTNVPTTGVYTLKCVPNSVVTSCQTTAAKITSSFSFSTVTTSTIGTTIFAYDSNPCKMTFNKRSE